MSKDMHRRKQRPTRADAPTPPASDKDRIVELYLRREPAYRREDVLRLTTITDADLDRAIADGDVTAEPFRDGEVFAWADVAHLALERWTPRMVEAALGYASDVIPHLNQHRLIRVSLPIYLIRMLDHLARVASVNVNVPRNASDVIEEQLSMLAGSLDPTVMEEHIEGFREALHFPRYTPRGGAWLRCRYCDVLNDEGAREVCRECTRRHEPDEHLGKYGLPELEKTSDD